MITWCNPGGGGGYRDVGLERPPSTLHKTPFSAFFSSTRPHFNQKWQNFPIFCSKYLNLVNFQFLSLKVGQNPVQEASFGPKISSESSIFVKKTVQQAPKFGANPFYNPIFGPLGHTPLPKWMLITPSPWDVTSWTTVTSISLQTMKMAWKVLQNISYIKSVSMLDIFDRRAILIVMCKIYPTLRMDMTSKCVRASISISSFLLAFFEQTVSSVYVSTVT